MQRRHSRHDIARLAVCALAAAALSGCGGGGGDSGGSNPPPTQPLQITDANAPGAAAEAIAAGGAGAAGSAGGVLTGVAVAPTGGTSAGTMAALAQAVRRVAGRVPAALVTGVDVNETIGCSGGGTAQASGRITLGGPVAGDALSLVFRGCIEEGVTLDGGLALAFTEVVGSADTSITRLVATATASAFSAAEGGHVERLAGAFTLTIDDTGASDSVVAVSSASMTLERLAGGAVRSSRTLSAYSYRLALDKVTGTGSETFALSAAGSFPKLGTVSFEAHTTQPIVTPAGAGFPSSGAALVTGAGGSTVTVTVLSAGNVRLEIDRNGDKQTDTTLTQRWADIQAEL